MDGQNCLNVKVVTKRTFATDSIFRKIVNVKLENMRFLRKMKKLDKTRRIGKIFRRNC